MARDVKKGSQEEIEEIETPASLPGRDFVVKGLPSSDLQSVGSQLITKVCIGYCTVNESPVKIFSLDPEK